ncbi:MAG: hypothetical protein JWP69_1850 [Flaviaesturariibacter sp.]|nr:hypothetical protein [Flaviaesturariibacter sp.]
MIEENKDKQREQDDSNRSDGEGTPIYLTSDSTLQSPEEHAHDKTVDPRKDTTREVSNDDLHEIKAGRLTGREDSSDNNP